jgi:hypothetical protein
MQRYLAGEKLDSLAAEFGVSVSFFSSNARRQGLPERVVVVNRCPHCLKKLKEGHR